MKTPAANPAAALPRTAQPHRGARRSALDKNLLIRDGYYYFAREAKDKLTGRVVRESFALGIEAGTKDAVKLARAKRDAHLAASLNRALGTATNTGAKLPVPTIGEIADAYDAHGKPDDNKTRRENKNALLNLARRAFGKTTEEVRRLPSTRLTAAAVHDFQRAYLEAAPDDDHEARATMAYGADCLFLKARVCLAHPGAFRDYALPDLSGFLKADKLGKQKKFARSTRFTPFTPDEEKKLIAALAALKPTNPRLYLFLRCMLILGCRNQEAAEIRREWIEGRTKDCTAWLAIGRRAYFKPKTQDRRVPIPPRLLVELDTLLPAPAKPGPLDHLVTPGLTVSTREDLMYRDSCDFVAAVLPGRTAYDLRKYAGSLMATQHGMLAARDFLGHASITTTESYYAANLEPLKPVALLSDPEPV